MDETRNAATSDPLLLLEIVLVLVLFALAVALYWIPAAVLPFTPGWWTWLLLGGVLVAILLLERGRRRRRQRLALRDALDAERDRQAEQRAGGR